MPDPNWLIAAAVVVMLLSFFFHEVVQWWLIMVALLLGTAALAIIAIEVHLWLQQHVESITIQLK